MLGLRYVRPSALMSFLLCECAIALAALLALADLVSWWAVAVLPLSIAAMVKLNDLVTGAMRRSTRSNATTRTATVRAPRRAAQPVPEPAAPFADLDARVEIGARQLAHVVQRETTTTQHGHRFRDPGTRRYHQTGSRHAASTNERRFGRSA
jgi:hypothetical protein